MADHSLAPSDFSSMHHQRVDKLIDDDKHKFSGLVEARIKFIWCLVECRDHPASIRRFVDGSDQQLPRPPRKCICLGDVFFQSYLGFLHLTNFLLELHKVSISAGYGADVKLQLAWWQMVPISKQWWRSRGDRWKVVLWFAVVYKLRRWNNVLSSGSWELALHAKGGDLQGGSHWWDLLSIHPNSRPLQNYEVEKRRFKQNQAFELTYIHIAAAPPNLHTDIVAACFPTVHSH